MFRKILITIAIIIGLLLVLNLLLSSLVTRSINEGLRDIVIEQDDTTSVQIRFDETNVNTLSSSFTINGLRIYNTGNENETTIGQLAVNLSYRDFFALILPRSEGEPPVIRRGQLRLNDFEFVSGSSGPGYRFDLLMTRIDGNLNELVRAIDTGFEIPPSQAQEVEAEVLRFQYFYTFSNETLGLSQDFPMPEIERFYLQGSYDPADDIFDVNVLSIELEQISLSAEASLRHISSFSRYLTESGFAEENGREEPFLRMNASAEPRLSKLDVGEGGGGLHFDLMNITYNGPFFEGIQMRDIFFTDGAEISLAAENFTFFMPRIFVDTYGAMFGFLGIPSDSFFLPGVRGSFNIDGNQAVIENFALENPFATVEIKGRLTLGNNEIGLARWEGASLNITPVTDQSREFIRTASSFFNLRLQQEDDTYVIPLTGTLSEPRLEGISRD
ncbi:MAG: hypothetical protein LAT84_06030 [Balneolia bacterium]|nr:hypothetical protein [Balneolia bacterium]